MIKKILWNSMMTHFEQIPTNYIKINTFFTPVFFPKFLLTFSMIQNADYHECFKKIFLWILSSSLNYLKPFLIYETNIYRKYFIMVQSIYSLNSFLTLIGLVGRVFANGLGDLGSISGRIIPKTLKMVLDTSLLNTQQYKVRIKGKAEPSRERIAPTPTYRCSSY